MLVLFFNEKKSADDIKGPPLLLFFFNESKSAADFMGPSSLVLFSNGAISANDVKDSFCLYFFLVDRFQFVTSSVLTCLYCLLMHQIHQVLVLFKGPTLMVFSCNGSISAGHINSFACITLY